MPSERAKRANVSVARRARGSTPLGARRALSLPVRPWGLAPRLGAVAPSLAYINSTEVAGLPLGPGVALGAFEGQIHAHKTPRCSDGARWLSSPWATGRWWRRRWW